MCEGDIGVGEAYADGMVEGGKQERQRIEKLIKKIRVHYFDDDEYAEMPLIDKEELLKEINDV
jgi:hypothetical protein